METGSKKAPPGTWRFQELSSPLLEEGKVLEAAHIGREVILSPLPVTSSSGSDPGARTEPPTVPAGVP